MRKIRFFRTVLALLALGCLFAACQEEGGDATPDQNQSAVVTACTTHTPGEWITVTEASESADGTRKRLCTVCGETLESESIPATGSTELAFIAVGENAYAVKIKEGFTGAKELVIPATYEGKPVTQIAAQGFGTSDASTKAACTALERITLPDSITEIGAYAFAGCVSLKSIQLPQNVTVLQHGAFLDCTALAKLTLPAGLLRIENAVFGNCDALTSVALPEGLQHLGASAFSDCDNLTSLSVPSSLQSLGGRVTYGCEKLSYSTYNGGKYLGNEQDNFLILEELGDKSATTYTVHSTTKFICALALDTGLLQSAVLPKTLRSIGVHTSPITYYYTGNAAEWENVSLSDKDLHGDYISAEKLYFYCDTMPSGAGNYWRYVAGKPKVW